jgi:DNA mismatch repair protein MutS2
LEKEDDLLRKMEFEFRKLMEDAKQSQPADMQTAKQKLKAFISTNRNRNNKERRSQFMQSVPNALHAEIKTGDRVTLINGTEMGIVETIEKEFAMVVFRNMKTKVPLRELVIVTLADPNKEKKHTAQIRLDQETFETEIDLRGKPKEEAMLELEQFLDKALIRNIYQLRILHGKGTGVLRNAVWQVLKTYPGIKKYAFESNNMGGDGVTLVEF